MNVLNEFFLPTVYSVSYFICKNGLPLSSSAVFCIFLYLSSSLSLPLFASIPSPWFSFFPPFVFDDKWLGWCHALQVAALSRRNFIMDRYLGYKRLLSKTDLKKIQHVLYIYLQNKIGGGLFSLNCFSAFLELCLNI